MRLAGNAGPQKIAQNWSSGHRRTTLSGYIFASKARFDNRKKLLNSNISPICPYSMVNFRPLMAEIGSGVRGTPAKFQPVSRLGSVTARHSSSGHSQTLRHWTEGATYIQQGGYWL